MRVCIHRGTHQIGGTCVEIESQGKRIVLDVGLPLDAELVDVSLPPVAGFLEPDDSLLGVFISHPHLDHYGLVRKLVHGTPILIGSEARKIIEAANKFFPSGIGFENTFDLKDKSIIKLGPFTLKPYLVDHSAYDSYALLVEAEGQRIFYSGDFRGHGRKGKLLDKLVANPPEGIDALLMEGSTLGRSGIDNIYPTESELEKRLVELISEARGVVLFWCAGQNIDRLVSVYRACRHSGRRFICDMYTASILKAVERKTLPKPGWTGFRVYLPWTQKRRVIKGRLFEMAKSFSKWRIYPKEINAEAPNSVMLFRPSMMKDLDKIGCVEDAVLIYSLWSGYLKDERNKPFLKWLDKNNTPLVHCHTSGHAPLADLKRFAKALAPKMLVPIHSFVPDSYTDFFDSVSVKQDGQWWEFPASKTSSTHCSEIL